MELLNLDPIKHLLPQVKGENRPLGLFISTFTWRDLTVRDHLSCQCPLGLVPHFYQPSITARMFGRLIRVNALSS